MKMRICAALVLAMLPMTGTAFAQEETGSICGAAWHDGNRDGRRQADEGPLAGRLFAKQNDAGGITTGADGVFCFENLKPGQYRLSSVQKFDAYRLTISGIDSKFSPETQLTEWITLKAGEQIKGIDAGFVSGAICGTAWTDPNQTGVRDSGEGPASERRIFGPYGSDPVFTAEDGRYCFENVTPGEHALYTAGFDQDRRVPTMHGKDSGFNWVTWTAHGIKVAQGERVTGIDLGLVYLEGDRRAVELKVEKTTYQVGDTFDVYGTVVAESNVPDLLYGTLTLPEGLRIVETLGDLPAEVNGQTVIAGRPGERTIGEHRTFGVRVTVEKAFTDKEIKLEADSHEDVDPADNVLTKTISTTGKAPVKVAQRTPLADTGVDPVAGSALGLGVLVLGGGLTIAARRRKV